MPTVVGITGLAGAGKDTLARAMQAELTRKGVSARLVGFADPIRQISSIVGLDPYDRRMKEHEHVIPVRYFNNLLAHATPRVLHGKVTVADAGSLLCNIVECVQGYVHGQHIRISPRQFMQILGTEAGQAIRKTFWVDIAMETWARDTGIVLVPDLRFEHELPAVDLVLCLLRPGLSRISQHPAEDMAARLTANHPGKINGKFVSYVRNGLTQEHLEGFHATREVRHLLKGTNGRD